MIVYLIPFFITIFGAIKYDICKENDADKYLLWYSLYVYLFLLIGLRYMVGGDSYFYMLYFNDFTPKGMFDMSSEADYQPLFALLTSFSKIIYPSFTSFQLLHSFIINTCLFYFIAKNSQYRFSTMFLCLLIFYINFTVEILRESLAIMVFVYNYKNLENKKWIRYYIGVFIAVMFHLSAVFLIVLPFLKFLRLNKQYLVLLIIAFLALSQLQSLFTFFENIEKINKKINDYSEASYGWKSTVLFFITRTLIPVGLLFWAKTKYNFVIKYEYLVCVFGLLGVCSIFNTIIFVRFTNYFVLFYCIALVDVLVHFFRLKTGYVSQLFVVVNFVIIVFAYGYLSFYWPVGYYEKWIPYYSVFSSEAQNDKFIDRDY